MMRVTTTLYAQQRPETSARMFDLLGIQSEGACATFEAGSVATGDLATAKRSARREEKNMRDTRSINAPQILCHHCEGYELNDSTYVICSKCSALSRPFFIAIHFCKRCRRGNQRRCNFFEKAGCKRLRSWSLTCGIHDEEMMEIVKK